MMQFYNITMKVLNTILWLTDSTLPLTTVNQWKSLSTKHSWYLYWYRLWGRSTTWCCFQDYVKCVKWFEWVNLLCDHRTKWSDPFWRRFSLGMTVKTCTLLGHQLAVVKKNQNNIFSIKKLNIQNNSLSWTQTSLQLTLCWHTWVTKRQSIHVVRQQPVFAI